ncbi:hypothetical protein [Bernardetia sp. MNP-M8]|uniref:hypothetical protein n=1 Tax=Bernardetia sp. MNP-M8 TaxID=3127470 RepID=UPI0030D06C6E
MKNYQNILSKCLKMSYVFYFSLIFISCDNHKQTEKSSSSQEDKTLSNEVEVIEELQDSLVEEIPNIIYSKKDILNRNLLSFSDSVLAGHGKKTIIHWHTKRQTYPIPPNALDSILVYSPVNYQGNRTVFTKAVYKDSIGSNKAFNYLISEKDSYSDTFKYGVLIFPRQNYIIYLNKECFSPPAFKTWWKYQQEFLNQILDKGESIKAINAECGAMKFEVLNVKSTISK